MTSSCVESRESVACDLLQVAPAIFDRESPRPLAIGIHYEIMTVLETTEWRDIRHFLEWWTHRHAYLDAMQREGSKRYHITGECQGTVSQSHRAWAARFQYWRRNKRTASNPTCPQTPPPSTRCVDVSKR